MNAKLRRRTEGGAGRPQRARYRPSRTKSPVLSQRIDGRFAPATCERIERFQGWVAGEVLLAIHRTGTYAPPAAPVQPSVAGMLEFLSNAENAIALITRHAPDAIEVRAIAY